MTPFTQCTSRSVVLADTNIDTDRIIPARFLTTTERAGLGKHAFHDWRYRADGSPDPDFVLNQEQAAGCSILVAGHNFGCGSSREHAPWALLDAGFRVVLSSEIADIFRNNALKNGLLAVLVDEVTHRWLLDNPGVELHVDVADQLLRLPVGREVSFELDPFARHCLLEGVDSMDFLLRHGDAVTRFEQRREAAA